MISIFFLLPFRQYNIHCLCFHYRVQDSMHDITFEFLLNVFTEFSELRDILSLKWFEPVTSCDRDQDATTAPARHSWETGSVNWPQFIPFRENSNARHPVDFSSKQSIWLNFLVVRHCNNKLFTLVKGHKSIFGLKSLLMKENNYV